MTVAKKASAGLNKSTYSYEYNQYLTRSELKELEEKEKCINTLWDLGLTDVPESLPLATLKKMIINRTAEHKLQQGIDESEFIRLKPKMRLA